MKSIMMSLRKPAVENVNFEALNLIPPAIGLEEQRAELVKGMMNVWYEYVPKCYDGKKAVPLIVQLHGGGNDGRRWVNYTVWHELAEREDFIVVYPNSPDYGAWSCEERDVEYLYDLIKLICDKYNVDKRRIFMQGMSNGDMMTLAYTLKHPETLAAAAYTTGPSAADALDGDTPTGELPIIQMRGELDINWRLTPETVDIYETRYTMNDQNRELWEEINGTKGALPELSIQGKDNFLYYRGSKAPIINWEIQGMGHREPAHAAQVYWDRLYSGCVNEDGVRVLSAPKAPLKGDDDTVIIALNSSKAYVNSKLVSISSLKQGVTRVFTPAKVAHFSPLDLGEMGETEAICAPAELLSAAFGAKVEYENAGDVAKITLADGRKLTLRSHSVLIDIDGKYTAMQKPCLLLCGVFYIPVQEFCAQILGKWVSVADDVVCISGHYSVLGRYTARIMRKLLDGAMRDRPRAKWDI